MPAIEMAKGHWLYDNSLMIQWLTQQHPQTSSMPKGPALRWVALLMEDDADKWLWRPAMWWRWIPKMRLYCPSKVVYQPALRRNIYRNLDSLQTDLDAWLEYYNNEQCEPYTIGK